MTVYGTSNAVTSSWKKYVVTFTATEPDVVIIFNSTGTYYIYHPQLELGNKATDWTAAPEDGEEAINNAQTSADEAQNTASDAVSRVGSAELTIDSIKECIASLVTDANDQSLMVQRGDGWTFCTSTIEGQITTAQALLDELTEKLGSTDAVVEALSNSVDEFGVIAEFIHTGSYTYTDDDGVEQTEPSIDLFETDTGFKLKITNTRILFTDGTTELLTINSKTQSLITPKATVKNELQVGEFVWKIRNNGNMGLVWKGVTS